MLRARRDEVLSILEGNIEDAKVTSNGYRRAIVFAFVGAIGFCCTGLLTFSSPGESTKDISLALFSGVGGFIYAFNDNLELYRESKKEINRRSDRAQRVRGMLS